MRSSTIAGDLVGVTGVARDPLGPRRLVLDEEGRHAPVPAADERDHPGYAIAVRALARLRDRVDDLHPGGAEGARVRGEVVGPQAVVDEAAAVLEGAPPGMVGTLAIERDQLEVGAVVEGDEGVVRAHGMPPARRHREAELPIRGGRLLQLRHRDDEMVDAADHRPPSAGATSPRKRLSWPR
jgi:hypothetical protein